MSDKPVLRVPLNPHPRAGMGDLSTQGMIAPMNQFVDTDGTLTPVSFRFLFGLYDEINQLKQRLANAGIQ